MGLIFCTHGIVTPRIGLEAECQDRLTPGVGERQGGRYREGLIVPKKELYGIPFDCCVCCGHHGGVSSMKQVGCAVVRASL